jgi:hypothetical protein
MPERACAMLDPVATVGKGGRAWSLVCAKPDPVGKSAISGVCHAGSGGCCGEGEGRGLRWVGKGGPRWGREFAEHAAARLVEHGEHAGVIGGLRGAATGGARRQNRGGVDAYAPLLRSSRDMWHCFLYHESSYV